MSDCLIWWGSRRDTGYGVVYTPSHPKGYPAHRMVYEECFGFLAPGMVVHHRCDIKSCVNPDHLEALPRGAHWGLHTRERAAERTHCKRGHEFTPENTYYRHNPEGRMCKRCNDENQRRRRLGFTT